MTVHVVGAGLAGLACAVRLAGAGRPVRIWEATSHAGGRCRSYHDQTLGRVIDNGNHLLLSGNRSALAYLDAIGAGATLAGPPEARFPFVDLATGERWTLRPNPGRLPYWIALPSRRVPGTRLGAYLAGWRLAGAGEGCTIADRLVTEGPLWERFWAPLATAILNTPPAAGSARLLWAALRESFALGGAGCRPLIAQESLAASFVTPAEAFLERAGAPVAFGQRLRALVIDGRVQALEFGDQRIALGVADHVVLAVPPAVAGTLVPGLETPTASHAIVNAHYLLPAPARLPGDAGLLGVVGGTAEWLFARGDLVSATVSAADALAEVDADTIAARIWQDVARALDLAPVPQPPSRIVKERRATFAQTPDAVRRRPDVATRWPNLWLAGDWTATGLPATIEGAIRSGGRAAERAGALSASN